MSPPGGCHPGQSALSHSDANNILSLTDWLMCVYCSRQQPKQDTGDSSTTQISLSSISEPSYASQPDIVYASIVPSTQAPDIDDDLYANDISANHDDDAGVIYSELRRADDDFYVVSPSGDLYAQVKKK